MSTKAEELKPGGCFHAALHDEPMFVLLARDPQAPGLVRQWADERLTAITLGQRPDEDMERVDEANELAHQMILWRADTDPKRWREAKPAEAPAIKKDYEAKGEWWHRSRLLILWEEDDARPVDRELGPDAFKRITGIDTQRKGTVPIARHDGGDWAARLYRGGWVLLQFPEGAAVGVVTRTVG